ncbi:type I-F CRISPR-associated protein Csy2 [Amphibiibacter pelophylacis]|uniref:Type I-F CRISPR-associated protein Csy2 n=1 Tax=Amphibiibacter pelophylacis TaxID=1799477 RepID=A0ACC6P0T9_9BURK
MNPINQDEDSGSVKWLVLPRLEVRGMNAQPAWWNIAAPGPMPARGLAQHIAQTGFARGALDLKGIALVWHHFELRGEHLRARPGSSYQEFFPHQHRGAVLINGDDYAKGSKTLSGQPTVRGDGMVTLILALDADAQTDLDDITATIDSGRFAGGSIVSHRFRASTAIHDKWASLRACVPTGFAFVDRSELITEAMDAGAKDPLDAFLACTQPQGKAGRQEPDKDFARPRSSWLTPYLAGYHTLTPAVERRMARDGHPHAFVEPLIGLGQLLSIRESGVIPFWDYASNDDGTYLIQEVTCIGGTKPAAKAYNPRAEASSTTKEAS